MKGKRLLSLVGSICLLLVLVALLLPACAKEEAPVTPEVKPIVWKFANYGSMASPWNLLPKWFFDEIETRSGGRLTCELHVAESLVPKKESPDAIKAGVCQSTVFVPPYYFSKTPLLGFMSYPFVMPGISQTGEKASSKDGIRLSFEIADKYCSYPSSMEEFLAWDTMFICPHGFTQYEMCGNVPVRTVEDIKGLRIRVTGPHIKVIEAFGGAPCWVSTSEAYEGLQKGTIDIFEHSAYFFHRYKIYEVSKYFIDDMQMGITVSPFVIKLSAFEALPRDIQTIVLEVKSESLTKFATTYYEEEALGRQVMREKGLEFIHFPASERDKMLKVAQEVTWPDWIEQASALGLPAQEMADWLVAEVKKAGW